MSKNTGTQTQRASASDLSSSGSRHRRQECLSVSQKRLRSTVPVGTIDLLSKCPEGEGKFSTKQLSVIHLIWAHGLVTDQQLSRNTKKCKLKCSGVQHHYQSVSGKLRKRFSYRHKWKYDAKRNTLLTAEFPSDQGGTHGPHTLSGRHCVFMLVC